MCMFSGMPSGGGGQGISPPPPPPPPADPATLVDAAVLKKKDDIQATARARAGAASTNVTGGQGLVTAADTANKQLLGS